MKYKVAIFFIALCFLTVGCQKKSKEYQNNTEGNDYSYDIKDETTGIKKLTVDSIMDHVIENIYTIVYK